jgi:fumarate hydratase class II
MIDFVYNACRSFERTYIESFDKNQNVLSDQATHAILWFTLMFSHTSLGYRKAQRLATDLHGGITISWRLSFVAQSIMQQVMLRL